MQGVEIEYIYTPGAGEAPTIVTLGVSNDTVPGGEGRANTLVGDTGPDRFQIDAVSHSAMGRSTRDFINSSTNGTDLIELRRMDADTTRSGTQDLDFIGSTGFAGQAGKLRFFTCGGTNYNIVMADVDSDRQADFQIFVDLTNMMAASNVLL